MPLPRQVRITEVGPRDGLQNEPGIVPTGAKVGFIDLLSRAGFPEIEVSSFVSRRWVPQLGDAHDVFARIERVPGVLYSALVPNDQGLSRAIAGGVGKVAVFTAASETFSIRNTNATIAETLDRFGPVIERARATGVPVRGYVSCVVACPYEGRVDPARVRDVVARLRELGVDEIDLGETIGVAVPTDIERLLAVCADEIPPDEVTLHLHDTRGTALACAMRAMELGVASFDASCGGLGGCPYAPGAAGNLATEDLVYLCHGMGIETGIDLDAVFAAGRHIGSVLGRRLSGRTFLADGARREVINDHEQ